MFILLIIIKFDFLLHTSWDYFSHKISFPIFFSFNMLYFIYTLKKFEHPKLFCKQKKEMIYCYVSVTKPNITYKFFLFCCLLDLKAQYLRTWKPLLKWFSVLYAGLKFSYIFYDWTYKLLYFIKKWKWRIRNALPS